MSGPKGRKWTVEELSLLRRLAYHATPSAIAAALGRSVLAVRTKAAHERLPLLDDAAMPHRLPEAAPEQHRRSAVADGGAEPGPGDYVVIYDARSSQGHPRLAIVCVSGSARPSLIRTTFSSAEEAGPRFEEQACRMAAAIGTRGFRCVDGRYTLLTAAPTSE